MIARAAFVAVSLALLVFLYPSSPAAASEVVVVRAEGTSTRTKDAGEAKSVAVEMALKGAVREAALGLADLPPGAVGMAGVEEEITADPLAFVKNYRILSEGWVSVHMGGAGGDGPDGPPGLDDGPWQEVIPDGPDELGPGAGAPPPDTEPGWSDEGWSAPEEVYHIRIEASVDATLLRAAIGRISGPAPGAEITEISVVLIDALDYQLYSRFRDALLAIPMVKDLSYDTFYRGRVVFNVRASGGSLDLKQRLEHEAGPEFVVIFGGPNTITAKALPAMPADTGAVEDTEEWR